MDVGEVRYLVSYISWLGVIESSILSCFGIIESLILLWLGGEQVLVEFYKDVGEVIQSKC